MQQIRVFLLRYIRFFKICNTFAVLFRSATKSMTQIFGFSLTDIATYFPISDPTLIFFIVLCIILLAPIIMGKLRIPHIIGMVIAGVIVGQYGLNILARDDSFELFGKVGLYYIMFLAGLEMDMEGLKRNSLRFVGFGLLTFGVPFLLTYFISEQLLGYSGLASLILGSIMGANTLIAYPVVGRYGLQRHTSVALSVGSSMIALFTALVILAAIVTMYDGNGKGAFFWVWFVVRLTAFYGGLIFFMPRLTRWFLRRYSDAIMQFTFVLAMLFLSAALAEASGLEGILGAFLCGLILNRYIPRLSALMSRIEFTGNALFIPYFLIGVGMLINVRMVFESSQTMWIVLWIVVVGTLGKAIAAYIGCLIMRLPISSGHMMFGLTSAHAAGAIAMVMVGMKLETAPGVPLVDDTMLNGVVTMILFTCIISSMVTEYASRQIILKDGVNNRSEERNVDDERILLPLKNQETVSGLVSLAAMIRNTKLNREVVALNVVYDDEQREQNQIIGRQLLDDVQRQTSATNMRVETQVRIAANIANGIKHAFKEFNASEIIMGMHIHRKVFPKFWGEFAQSLYNGLSRQIMFVRLKQPLNTLRKIQVAVPSRAEYEPGFYRWVERISRLAENIDCRIEFHGRNESLQLIRDYVNKQHPSARAEYTYMAHWNELPQLAAAINEDHMFVVVTARKGTVSYKTALERLPDEIERHFRGKTVMIIYPDQYGKAIDSITFAESEHQEETSAYQLIIDWIIATKQLIKDALKKR